MKIEAKNLHVLNGNRTDNLLALSDLSLDGAFVVKGVRVLQSDKGPFVSLPSYKDREGKYQDVVFPVTKEGREAVNKTVLDAYAQALEKGHEAEAPEAEQGDHRKESPDQAPPRVILRHQAQPENAGIER